MQKKVRAVVLGVMKYSEKNSIAQVLTDSCGRLALLLPQAATRGARLRAACFMPLSLVEMQVDLRPGRELSRFSQVSLTTPLVRIHSDPVRGAIALFVAEFLAHTVRADEHGPALWQYVEQSVILLENARRGVANFHICFLYHIGPLLGIQPDISSYHDGWWFDLDGGVFTPTRPQGANRLDPGQAAALHRISHITFDNMHLFRFTREQRGEVLALMLNYFRLHYSTIGSMRSPEVLSQLFV